MPVLRPALLSMLLLGTVACSGHDDAQQAAAPAAPPADESAGKLETYRKLLSIHNESMAVQMGQDILNRYPDTPAAAEVNKTLPDLKVKVEKDAEEARLKNLWQYQTAPMAGGTQVTATIYSSRPSGDDRVRLVLRRHTAWGQSVFLFGSGKGFSCAGNCKITATYDGKPHPLVGYRPTTGEPAMFIKNDQAFITELPKVKKIQMEIVSADRGKQTLTFETAGYDASKFPALPKKK